MARPGLDRMGTSAGVRPEQSHVAVVLSNFNHDTIHPEIIDRMIKSIQGW